MIGYLNGTINFKSSDSVNLLVGGVGYEVFITQTLLASLLISTPLVLYTHTHVREDALDLYGFKTPEELSLFKLLISVSGVGSKTALLVIDKGVSGVINAISSADVEFLTDVPRLGKKNAQKVIIELKNKIAGVKAADLDLNDPSNETNEVVEALSSMGYSKNEVLRALKNIPSEELSVAEKIRFALKELGK